MKKNQKIKSYRIALSVYAMGVFLSAAVLSDALLYSKNILLLNGNWIATKRTLEQGVMGADEFLITRSPLAGNKLDLGSWYGYQEILSKVPRQFKKISFRFELPEQSYIDFIYDKTEIGSSGIRISNRDDLPSIYYESDQLRRIISSKNIPLQKVSSGWHLATISTSQSGISLNIDDQNSMFINSGLPEGGKVGFFTGINGAVLDDINIVETDGSVFYDSFRNSKALLLLIIVHAIILIALVESVFWIIDRYRKWAKSEALHFRLLTIYVFLIIAFTLHLFDFFYWSKLSLQPRMRSIQSGVEIPQIFFEKLRLNLFQKWQTALNLDQNLNEVLANEKYPFNRVYSGPVFCSDKVGGCRKYSESQLSDIIDRKICRRIGYIGTSQTIGLGAQKIKDTFYARLQEEISHQLRPKCLESLNIAVSGSNIKELEKKFSDEFSRFVPDVILINLSNNDVAADLEKHLPNMISQGRKLGARILLVEEPNSGERDKQHLLDNHKVLRRLGKQLGVSVLPLHDFLKSPEIMASGALWWDYVHLSSYGQSLVADWLKPVLLQELKARKKTSFLSI